MENVSKHYVKVKYCNTIWVCVRLSGAAARTGEFREKRIEKTIGKW